MLNRKVYRTTGQGNDIVNYSKKQKVSMNDVFGIIYTQMILTVLLTLTKIDFFFCLHIVGPTKNSRNVTKIIKHVSNLFIYEVICIYMN